MSGKTIRARLKQDGTVVMVADDGTETPAIITTRPPKSEAEIEAAALSDPDNPPWSAEQLSRARRISLAKHLRWKLGLTQQAFADRYHIPLGTLRDWEQHRSQPDQPSQTLLHLIRADPEGIARMLAGKAVAA